MGMFAEADSAHGEAPDVGLGPTTDAAAVMLPRRVLRRPHGLFDERFLRHWRLS